MSQNVRVWVAIELSPCLLRDVKSAEPVDNPSVITRRASLGDSSKTLDIFKNTTMSFENHNSKVTYSEGKWKRY